MTKGSEARDAYIALRKDGVEQWEAFRQAGRGRSASTCEAWERWYRSEAGLPKRESGIPRHLRTRPPR